MPEPDFLSLSHQFQLGILDTEQPHPLTTDLSRLANHDLPAAIAVLKQVDHDALALLSTKLDTLSPLAAAITRTIDRGGRLFLCGCGATGRLSISLEILARTGLLPDATVLGFMAGGDAALIRSIERFEDRPAFGKRQLEDLGFRDGDLLISSTEGGETPFVIGATEAATALSTEPPFFLYCNPDDLLIAHVERSRRVLENPAIRKINLAVGPMALSGSTRMQASTVLMAAIGFAMKHHRAPAALPADFERWRHFAVEECYWSFLAPFITAEADTYRDGDFVLYEPGPFGITVLTDTTERSPTFTLSPFERFGEKEQPSLCYLRIPEAHTPAEAWQLLLHRAPRPLEWGELSAVTGATAMARFDFSADVLTHRQRRTPEGAQHHLFRISLHDNTLTWTFRHHTHHLPLPAWMDELGRHLLLKLLLNTHSTLIMGRLGRYEDNLMTHVAANNFKLIDRAIRYTRLLLERHHHLDLPYDQVAQTLLHQRALLHPTDPIVLKTIEALLPE